MTETFLRFELSLSTIGSATTDKDHELRGFLRRVLVPALGVPAAQGRECRMPCTVSPAAL